MVSAIQTVASASIASQIVGQAAVSQPASQTSSLLVLPSTTVSLGTTTVPITYSASGLLDMGSSSGSATLDQSIPTQASVVAADSAQNAANIQLAADLEASTIAENLAILDKALADSLARQLLANTKENATALDAKVAANTAQAGTVQAIETSRQIELARQAVATSSARTLDEILAARVNQSSAITNTTPAAMATAVAASNTTTDNLGSTSEVANFLVANPAFDAVVQAVTVAAQNPAYANLVAQNYASVAASSPLNPSVTVPPITPDEATAAFAISSVTDLAQPVSTTSKQNVIKTDGATTLPLLTPQPLPITNEPAAVTSITPATTTSVAVASNTATSSLGNNAEIANSPVVNPVIDPVAQAVTTVAQNPAYANLVAGNYVSMAASSTLSPSVVPAPIRLVEIKPVIAIPAISALGQLGAQSGRDGNSASGNGFR